MDEKDKKRLTTNVGVKGNVRYITITDNVEEHWHDLLDIAKASYTWYAYIYHDKDNTNKHLHMLLYDEGGTSLKAHCQRFESVIPPNFVLKVWSPRAMARYLVHKDSPDKYQYNVKDIVTNGKDKLLSFFREQNSDCCDEFQDFVKVRSGQMTVMEFLDKYRGEFASMPFYHKLTTYSKLMDGYNINNERSCNATERNQGDK